MANVLKKINTHDPRVIGGCGHWWVQIVGANCMAPMATPSRISDGTLWP